MKRPVCDVIAHYMGIIKMAVMMSAKLSIYHTTVCPHSARFYSWNLAGDIIMSLHDWCRAGSICATRSQKQHSVHCLHALWRKYRGRTVVWYIRTYIALHSMPITVRGPIYNNTRGIVTMWLQLQLMYSLWGSVLQRGNVTMCPYAAPPTGPLWGPAQYNTINQCTRKWRDGDWEST